jgi:class 3 adenylate cyclase/tetratricopeptide (TPR) repeat protein
VEAERKQVTVLFADMVGYTTYSEQAGEEAAFTLMRSLSKLMDETVREHGGFVQSFTGDGMMAVFGAPVAVEDAPIRACRAALSILQRLKRVESDFQTIHGMRPRLRIGLNTGVAVVGQIQGDADAGIAVLGDTVNLASRLQTIAEPNSVFISQAIYRLVQGMVEATFAGEHSIKGKSEPQKVYRLDAIRHGASRFDAAMSRGLSAFVGRERELELLDNTLADARSGLRVIDLVAEPGMGKSRLLHEFRARIGRDNPFVLTGNCSPDGKQTAFLPFLEVVRTSFRVSIGETEGEIAQKLETGLTALGLYSLPNLGLLLHLLGLKVPDGALAGLDGALIGLRTRELSQQLLEARCRISPVIMFIEDVHWIDSVSEELLGKIIDSEAKLRLLIISTRRPEYVPSWLNRAVVSKLHLDPLPAGDIRRLIQGRLGTNLLPDTLVRQVTEKAEGNPLFAEEIMSLLTERAVLRSAGDRVEFDSKAVAAILPASVQSVFTARVDQLAPKDRLLLQAASAIGRRFDTELLVVVVNETRDIDDRLAAMQALDLVRKDENGREYCFKHALVRDALYDGLLTESRKVLHFRIAKEIERRSGNRLIEVAEALAHHYSQTDQTDKAFAYLSMAGSRSLSVYSLDEAEAHFSAAIALLETHPECASDDQVANALVEYTLLENALGKLRNVVDVPDKFKGRLEKLGDSAQLVLIMHQKVFGLCFMTEFKAALAEQAKIIGMAERLGDERSKAYAYASEILVSSAIAPRSVEDQGPLVKNALDAASRTEDSYIRSVVRWVIAIDEISRGRMKIARDIAEEMSEIGRNSNDPRPIGMGMGILAWIALTSDDYVKALDCANECLRVAYTPQERMNALGVSGAALALLRRLDEAQVELDSIRKQLNELNWQYELLLTEPAFGVLMILSGKVGEGVSVIERAMSAARRNAWRVAEDWAKLFLCEIYLEVMFPKERSSILFLLRNLFTFIKILFVGRSSIEKLVSQIQNNPQFDPNGHHIGRTEMILGLLYKGKKKYKLAAEHLTKAKSIFSQFGQTPILARVDAALMGLAD